MSVLPEDDRYNKYADYLSETDVTATSKFKAEFVRNHKGTDNAAESSLSF